MPIFLLSVFFFLLANPAFAAYLYSRSITIPSSEISGGADLTKFPILVCGNASSGACNTSVPGMATVGNGGHVQNSNGYDIIFTTDSACSNKLTWEMESYVASTGEFEAWVTNTSTALSHSTNTTFYMCYGNSAISTFQSTASSVWDSNYMSVWHFPNGTTLSAADSTTNSNTGTITNATATSGRIDGAASFNSTNTYILGANTFNSSPATVSAWVYLPSYPSGNGILAGCIEGLGSITYDKDIQITYDGYVTFYAYNSAEFTTSQPSSTLSTSAWHYLVGTVGSSGQIMYIDGSSVGTVANTGSYAAYSSANTMVGGHIGSSPYVADTTDEVRFSSIQRSAGWIATEYNNQSAPASFYTMSSEMSFFTSSFIGGKSTIGGTSTVF